MTEYWDVTLGTFPGVPEVGQQVDYYTVVGIPCEPRRGIVAEPYVGGRFVIEFPNGDRTITWPGNLALPGHPIRQQGSPQDPASVRSGQGHQDASNDRCTACGPYGIPLASVSSTARPGRVERMTMYTVETFESEVIAAGSTLVEAHDNAIAYFRNHREVRHAYISGPDGAFIMQRPRLMSLYFDRENIAERTAHGGLQKLGEQPDRSASRQRCQARSTFQQRLREAFQCVYESMASLPRSVRSAALSSA